MKEKTVWDAYVKTDLRYGVFGGSIFFESKADVRWVNIFGIPHADDTYTRLRIGSKILGDE